MVIFWLVFEIDCILFEFGRVWLEYICNFDIMELDVSKCRDYIMFGDGDFLNWVCVVEVMKCCYFDEVKSYMKMYYKFV